MSSMENQFKSEWSSRYGVLQEGHKVRCILCSTRLQCKGENIKRHYENMHKEMLSKTEEEQRTIFSDKFMNKKPIFFSTMGKDRTNKFAPHWTTDYGMVSLNSRACCVLCLNTVLCRGYSTKRHFQTMHRDLASKPREEQLQLIAQAVEVYKEKTKVEVVNDDSQVEVAEMKAATPLPELKCNIESAAFQISQLIANHGRTCCDAEYMTELWTESIPILMADCANMDTVMDRIKNMPAFQPKLMIMNMAKNVVEQQNEHINGSPFLSLCIDENTDRNGLTSLALILSYIVNNDIKEELIGLTPLPANAQGRHVFHAVVKLLTQRHINMCKIVSITTDGSAKMLSHKDGFMKLFQSNIGVAHEFIGFHSIMHARALCEDSCRELDDIMSLLRDTVHLILAREPNRVGFSALLREARLIYNNLLIYNDVRYFSRGQILQNFVDCLDDVIPFLHRENMLERHEQLRNSFEKTARIMFFTDLCKYIYMINDRMQYNIGTILNTIDLVKEIDVEFKKFEMDIICHNFEYFLNVKTLFNSTKWKLNPIFIYDLTKEFNIILKTINGQFIQRFQQILKLEETLKFLIYPDTVSVTEMHLEGFLWLNIDKFQSELKEFQSIPVWTHKFVMLREHLSQKNQRDNGNVLILTTWNLIPASFECMKKLAYAMLTIFSSTRSCESLFDDISLVCNNSNQIFNPDYNNACLLLKVTKYKPNVNYLVAQLEEDKTMDFEIT